MQFLKSESLESFILISYKYLPLNKQNIICYSLKFGFGYDPLKESLSVKIMIAQSIEDDFALRI